MSDDQNDIPLSEPLPEGIELTEVADGERSEVMERALIDAANSEELKDPGPAWAPTPVWEVPDHLMQGGQIAYHDGSTESAVRIAEWLNTIKVSAFVVPAHAQFPAFVRLQAFQFGGTRNLLTKGDYVFVSDSGHARVYDDNEASILFRVQNDDTEVGHHTPHLPTTPRSQ